MEYLGFTRIDVLGLPLSNASTLDQNIERAIERDGRLNPQEIWARFVARTQIAYEMMMDYALRVMEVMEVTDQSPHDLDPDACWRCDAREASDELGLCGPCHVDLVDGREDL